MTKKPFGSSDEQNQGSPIPGSAGQGGDPGMPIRPGKGDRSQPGAGSRGQSGGEDAGNTGAGSAGGGVETGGIERTPDDDGRTGR